METVCLECGTPVQQIAGGRPRLYCSNGCRQAAHRRRHAACGLFPAGCLDAVGQEHGILPTAAPTEDQVACAILEARAIASAFLRLGREACPQLRWRCEGVGKALHEDHASAHPVGMHSRSLLATVAASLAAT